MRTHVACTLLPLLDCNIPNCRALYVSSFLDPEADWWLHKETHNERTPLEPQILVELTTVIIRYQGRALQSARSSTQLDTAHRHCSAPGLLANDARARPGCCATVPCPHSGYSGRSFTLHEMTIPMMHLQITTLTTRQHWRSRGRLIPDQRSSRSDLTRFGWELDVPLWVGWD